MKKKKAAKNQKFRITEQATYEVEAPNGQEALRLFLHAEDRDKRYFVEVSDRVVYDEHLNCIDVDEDEASP